MVQRWASLKGIPPDSDIEPLIRQSTLACAWEDGFSEGPSLDRIQESILTPLLRLISWRLPTESQMTGGVNRRDSLFGEKHSSHKLPPELPVFSNSSRGKNSYFNSHKYFPT
ncbi:hypothetical protein CEXT_747811 [Caerostris extrusa]|uniref:Uncharacterized protein n=1 Tax=Caerostris extrusa TaxID=172846 RepID=A0AAV4T4V5_CAEEX|nr:hypothetical protein CEXT_747811 [Caerostris extrusa]